MEDILDESEDLILKDSPLDQYLKEIGVCDFSSYSLTTLSENLPSDSDNNKVLPSSVLKNGSFLHPQALSLKINFTRIWIKIKSFMMKILFATTTTDMKLLQCIEDLAVLFSKSELLCDSMVNPIEKRLPLKQDRWFIKNETSFIGNSTLAISFLLLLVCVLAAIASGWIIVWFFAAPSLLLSLIIACRSYYLQRTDLFCGLLVSTAGSFTENCEVICRTFDKSFLLVRECEVISQGWTFYHPGIPALKAGSRKRGSCSALRESMMRSSFQIFEITASAAKLLVNYLPENLRLIYAEDGVFNITSEEIKSSIDEALTEEDVHPHTDMLRSMICLVKSGIVELFQVICLILDEQLKHDDNSIECSSELQLLIGALTKIFKEKNKSFDRILPELSSKYLFTKENEFKENLPKNKPKSLAHGSPYQMKLDSASLHLKSALGFLEQIGNLLSSDVEDQSLLNNREALYHEINQLRYVYSCDLDSAKDCVNDLESLLMPKKIDNSSSQCLIKPNLKSTEENPDIICSIDESVVHQEGDLLLEGISEFSEEKDCTINYQTSLVEEQKLKQQLNESKRLVNELKVIFSFKKSPIGLMPLDLVKENMNLGTDEKIDRFDNNTDQLIPSNQQNDQQMCFSHETAIEHEAEKSFESKDDLVDLSSEGEAEKEESQGPSMSVINDLKSMLLVRQQRGFVGENLIEADTFGSDEDDCSDFESH